MQDLWKGGAYPVEYVKDDSHGHTELLKVKVSVIVDVGQVPHPLELIIAETTVLEDRGGLLASEELGTTCASGKDVPVGLDLLGFDLGRHGCGLR